MRTPLNAVIMGLTLLLDELEEAFGEEKPKADEANHVPPESALAQSHSTVDTEQVESWRSLTRDIFSNAQTSVDVLNDLLNYDK